jgi:hypothetical protein
LTIDPVPSKKAVSGKGSVRLRRPSSGHLVRITPDRRRFKRVRINLLGRFMRANQEEYPCQVVNMSPGDVAVLSPVNGEIAERIVLYIDHIGRIEGEIARLIDGGFAVRIQATGYKREKIANQLTWLINRDRLNLAEDRRFERVVPKNPFTKIALPDGVVQNCRVLDVSLSGASIAINPKPEIGADVVVGLMRGRVVRHHEHGIGIQFLDVQDDVALRRHFG